MSWQLFEFIDAAWTPPVVRRTLLETLDFCNAEFRGYYAEIAEILLQSVSERGVQQIVEVGAGSAPLTRALMEHTATGDRRLIPCDLYPEPVQWRALQEADARVAPILKPVDCTEPQAWDRPTAMALCATLHHLPSGRREAALRTMLDASQLVAVFEPICRHPVSFLLTSFAWFPAILMPVFRWRTPGRLRRALLCFPIPIVPLMFVWDGLASCLRQWPRRRWNECADRLQKDGFDVTLTHLLHGTVFIAVQRPKQ